MLYTMLENLRLSKQKKGVNKVMMDLIYTFLSLAEAGGFEPPVQLPVRQFSKLVVSATHPHFLLYIV